jgi:hypothetical protein
MLLAAIASVMVMVREQDAFVLVGPALDFGRELHGRTRSGTPFTIRDLLVRLTAAGVTFGVVYLPQAFAYLALNGRLGPSRLVERKMAWTSPHALGVLFSPEHGLFFWTPLAVLAVGGLFLLARRGRPSPQAHAVTERDAQWLAVCGLAMVGAQVYVAGSVESWTVAGAFGQRRFVALTVLLTIGLAALFNAIRGRAPRLALASLVVVCVWWNIGLMAQFGSGLMDRQRLDLPRNAYNTFVTVPGRLPELVTRYLFDRPSFYKGGRAGNERL